MQPIEKKDILALPSWDTAKKVAATINRCGRIYLPVNLPVAPTLRRITKARQVGIFIFIKKFYYIGQTTTFDRQKKAKLWLRPEKSPAR